MKNLKATLILTLQLFLLVSTSAQTQKQMLDKLFESNYDKIGSGASILISQKGKIIYQNQSGYANVEHRVPIDENTSFSIGSITKQFTAAAILLLEEKAQLNLNDPLSKYLSELPKGTEQVLIHQLLTHTSGLKDYPRVPAIRKRMRENLKPREIIALLENEPLDFEAGSSISYSNTGYVLLGLLIEKVSGQTYTNFLKEHIFAPLLMTNTKVASYEQIIPGRANGYTENENDDLINATFHTSSFAAGAIVSTPTDLNKWITALQNGKVLNGQSLKKMFSNYQLKNGAQTNLGLGWEWNQIAEENCFEHSGFEPGYKANSVYFPKQELYVVVLQNNEYGSPTPTMIDAAAICLGKPFPTKKDAVKLRPEAAQKLTGTYKLASGEQRIIFQKEEQFFIKTPGGRSSKLFPKNNTTLYYEEGYRQLLFKKNDAGEVDKLVYKSRNNEIVATKVSNEVPLEKTTIKITPEVLQNYVGTYKLEAFNMKIMLKNDLLFAEPEGANMLPLSPVSESSFIIEEIGAELDFTEEGGVQQLSLLLEGNRMKGVKIN